MSRGPFARCIRRCICRRNASNAAEVWSARNCVTPVRSVSASSSSFKRETIAACAPRARDRRRSTPYSVRYVTGKIRAATPMLTRHGGHRWPAHLRLNPSRQRRKRGYGVIIVSLISLEVYSLAWQTRHILHSILRIYFREHSFFHGCAYRLSSVLPSTSWISKLNFTRIFRSRYSYLSIFGNVYFWRFVSPVLLC